MVNLDENFVNSLAPNASAISNGRGLLLAKKFVALNKSNDDSLFFGECSGSGKSNYACSCDFLDATKPVFRCTCPSRQFPCKHCLGLMYAIVAGEQFTVAEIPADIAEKRGKLEVRKEKKKVADATPKKVNKGALTKKINAQLAGLDLLEKLTHDLVRTGMGNTNAKTAQQIEEQAKQLGNAYLPGAQAALLRYTNLFINDEGKFDSNLAASGRESIYSEAIDQLARLNSIIKRGREYLANRRDDPELAPETESPIAAWLGHAWQLSELRAAGLVETNVELIQVAFNSYDDVARQEFVDTGVWMNLNSGKIQLTQNFRPYKAAKHIKSEDSFFKIAKVPELCIYPGDVNPRIRWEAMEPRDVEQRDFQTIRKFATGDLAQLIKDTKNRMKSALGDKQPIVAVNFQRIGRLNDQTLILEDQHGQRIAFTDAGRFEEPDSCHLFALLPPAWLKNQTLIGRFHFDLDSRALRMKPLSLLTDSQIFRLTL